jgi:hypothetical protein
MSAGPLQIWVVGDNGASSCTLRRYSKATGQWIPETLSCTAGLRAVGGTASNDIHVVGLYSTTPQTKTQAFHHNGSMWPDLGFPGGGPLLGVWAASSSFAVAVGQKGSSGVIYHWSGGTNPWVETKTDSLDGGGSGFRAVSGLSSSDVWAVGDLGAMWHYNGTSWQGVPSSDTTFMQTLHGVWAKGASDVYMVGTGGTVLHWAGNSYASETTNVTTTLRGITGRASDAIAVGDGGTILYKAGASVIWSKHTSGTNSNLNAVWCHSVGVCCYAVGDGGVVLERCKL